MDRWSKVAPGLQLAVGVRVPIKVAPAKLAGMIKHEAPPGATCQNFYWPLEKNFRVFSSPVPKLPNNTCGELRFRRKNGYRVIFGRNGENHPFGFTRGEYVTLRFNQEETAEKQYKVFNPVYIRVDKGAEISFAVLKIVWRSSAVSITAEELKAGDKQIPGFLTRLPEYLQLGVDSYLTLD